MFRSAYAIALGIGLAGAVPPAHADHHHKSGAGTDNATLTLLGTYRTGVFDGGAAEIAAYSPETRRLYVVNAEAGAVDILDIADPARPAKVGGLSVAGYGAGATSVATHGRLVAVAAVAEPKQAPGRVVFFDLDGRELGTVEVGALPDMLTFTPDGRKVLVANEGEPSGDYAVDPEGSVSIVDLSNGVDDASIRTAGFAAFNGKPLPNGLRLARPGATVAQDLEPEYIAVSADGRTAWVTLQENNGLAVVDIERAEIVKLVGLGFKDWRQTPFDASDKDGGIDLDVWPVYGLYQPDAIASYRVDGRDYLVTANEGDARDYDGFSEEARIAKRDLDPEAFPNAAELQDKAKLGRLKVTTQMGDTDSDGDHDALYAFGARSFSIWDADGNQVYDSGADFERVTAARLPENFNATNDKNGSFDNRSDDKGPEPEAVTVGEIGGRTFAFIGLERIGGVMIYDVSEPASPVFAGYTNNRDFSGDPEAGTAGDLGPEGLVFIPADDSPNGRPLLVVANEVSGTTSVFQVNVRAMRKSAAR